MATSVKLKNPRHLGPIKWQQQPTSNTCVAACIAMIVDAPVEQIVDAFHHQFFDKQTIKIRDILTYLDLSYNARPLDVGSRIMPGLVYLLTVPSLNVQGCFHCVVVDYRDPSNPRVLDPGKGRKGSKYYTLDNAPSDPLAFIMVSWIVEFEIHGFKDSF